MKGKCKHRDISEYSNLCLMTDSKCVGEGYCDDYQEEEE